MVFSIFAELCNQSHDQFLNIFITQKEPRYPLTVIPPFPWPHPQPEPTNNLLLSVFLFHVSAVRQYAAPLSVCFHLHNISCFIHAMERVSTSFFPKAGQYSFV